VNNRVDGRISIRDVGDPARKLLQFRTVYDVRSAARDARARGSVRLALIVGLVDGAARIVDQKEWTAASQAGP
jgi:hypothetical protein